MSAGRKKIVKYTNYFLVYSTIHHIFAVSNNARKTQGGDATKLEGMTTKVTFLDPTQVKIVTSDGDTYILGYPNTTNFVAEHQLDRYYSKCVIDLFDKYYDGNPRSIVGPIAQGLKEANLEYHFWVIRDRDKERERIGKRIRELRREMKMDAKELAQKVGIDAGNLSKIEKGRYSVGIDILNKIAAVLETRIDFVPLEEKEPFPVLMSKFKIKLKEEDENAASPEHPDAEGQPE